LLPGHRSTIAWFYQGRTASAGAVPIAVELPVPEFGKERAMNALSPNRTLRVLLLCAFSIAVLACGRQDEAATESAPELAATKVPVTTSSEDAREAFLTGRALLSDLHSTESIPFFEQAVSLDPDFAMSYVLLAAASQTAAQFFLAIENAEASTAGLSQGEKLIVDAVVAASRNDQRGQAKALADLLDLYPDDERVHNRLGNYYNGQQNFSKAIEHYEKAVTINPSYATAYNSLGYAHRSSDQLDAAKTAFEKYVELIPDEANPYDSYAELLMEMGQYDESIQNYRKSIKLDRNFASAYAGISINEALRGDPESALEAAAQMYSVARTAAEKQRAIFRAVTCHLFAGDIDAAMAASEDMFAIAEADANEAAMGVVREYMGDIMIVKGEGEKAFGFYDRALKHREKAEINDANKALARRTHLFKTAIAAMITSDGEKATALVAKYRSAAEQEGTAAERRRVHEHAGYLAIMNEDDATAMAELALANNFDPVVLYWSAVVNKNVGNNERAIELATRAVTRNTLSGNLPFYRSNALLLLDELSGT
jgi:tetratricopeptide (TPR) repeat protein